MKRLLALAALLTPIYLFAQGFGSFSHDQPFLAVDGTSISGGSTFPITNLFIWYMADAGTFSDASSTLPTTNGAITLRWANQASTNFNGATTNFIGTAMADGDDWPKYYTNQVNGLPALLFNGTCWHSGIKAGGVGGLGELIAQPYQVFMVYNITNNALQAAIWGESAFGQIGVFTLSGTGSWFQGPNGSVNYGVDPLNTWRIQQFTANGSSSFMRTNGVIAGSPGNFSNASDLNGFIIGDLLPFQCYPYRGWVAETMIYKPALSSNDAFRVEMYLSRKYQITNSVLTGL